MQSLARGEGVGFSFRDPPGKPEKWNVICHPGGDVVNGRVEGGFDWIYDYHVFWFLLSQIGKQGTFCKYTPEV